ncbi:unnamed protein product [Caenorhabditis bovis]|uniref:aralkylamine N-acetyltransferase n=1 Tax=Caenorhabditis bovis TaxID=2654633 RepID=A0A8S1FEC8_9PELO|nr:unnamed protein product [Caenorhabditis bovis]
MSLNDLEYLVATKEDQSEILDFLLTYFYKEEPCTKALKLAKEEVGPLYASIIERCLRYPFSTVVRTPTAGIVGVLLNSVWRRDDEASSGGDYDDGEHASPNMSAFVRFLNRAHDDLWDLLPPNVDAVLHREISSVATAFQRNGIATKMLTANVSSSRLDEFNIGGVLSETSSFANQTLLAKHGFKCLKELAYSEMRNARGDRVLTAPLDGAHALRLNYKSIDEFEFEN